MIYNDYIGIYKPDHHRAMNNGMVYEHILVAESMLGRELIDSEVVHHIDGCKSNNDVSNLMVFKTVSDHTRYHNTGICKQVDDGTFISPVLEFINGYDECPICGGKKVKRAAMCSSCYHTFYSVKPSKEELGDLLKAHNKSSIARLFGVSDSAVRKWIKSYQL